MPIVREGGSDSAIFDNVLELLVMAGRPLPHAILMMIPEPWQNNDAMDPALRAFYEYHASLMEPWDGPASLAFTDGTVIGAVLDRNGLRPSRYYVTKDDLVVMASEVGVLDIPAEDVVIKERLHPGRIFLVDTAQGRIISDDELKHQLAREQPYAAWLQEHLIPIADVAPAPFLPAPDHATVLKRQQAFGYTQEDIELILRPMALGAEEPLGSMGTDTPLAVLSQRPRLLYDYFKQLFAQVTNPPLDAIREELVTSMESTIGPERNLLLPEPESCRQIVIKYPIIANDDLAKVRHTTVPGFRSVTLPMLYASAEGGAGLERALDALKRQAREAVADGHTVLILSDRGVSRELAPIPSLLATAGVHHHLVREGMRTRCALVVESGDAREVHHVALLIGYGAGAVNPVSGVRDAGRHDPAARHRGPEPRARGAQLHQGAQQGHPQGDVEDGDLDAAELLRRADLRGHRPRQGLRRSLLHLDGVAHRRRRHRASIAREVRERHRRAFPTPQPDGVGAGERRRIQVAPRRRAAPVQPGNGPQAAARDPQQAVLRLQGVLGARERSEPQPRHAARAARLQGRRRRCRSTKWSRSSRSSSGSPPARCRTARSARKRTRRSPSP